MLDRLDDTRLAVVQAKDATRTASGRRRGATTSASARRERVARSRERAQGLKAGDSGAAEEPVTHMSDADAVAAQPSWEGSALPNDDGSAPDGFEIKGNADSMKYHEPGSRYYNQTKAEVYFDTVENAEAAGFAPTTEEAHAHEEAEAEEVAEPEASEAAADDASAEENN